MCDRLSEGHVDASEVEIVVNNGEVTLQGSVDYRREKHVIEDIAEQVPGVADVHNQLKVKKDPGVEDKSATEAQKGKGTESRRNAMPT